MSFISEVSRLRPKGGSEKDFFRQYFTLMEVSFSFLS